MAFAFLIGSVAEVEIGELRAGTRARLQASKIARASHILASWVALAPLNRVLREVIDGGQLIGAGLWHPWRPPLFHSSAAVQLLRKELDDAFAQAIREHGVPASGDWYAIEIGKVVGTLAHAADRGESIVRFLEPPDDEERARSVSIPLDEVPG